MSSEATLTSNTPLVSVIIPAYNAGRFLAEAVDSVLGQTYSNTEIIVINDGSTDDTAAVAARYEDRIRYIATPNAGASAARNRGLKEATGGLIAFLDADDRWKPHKLERQVQFLQENPDIDLVYARTLYFDTRDERIVGEKFEGADLDIHDLLAHRLLGFQTLLFHRYVFETVGFFDEALRGAEDWDFCLRIATNYKLHGLDEPLIEVRRHDSHLSGNSEMMYRCSMQVLKRHSNVHKNCIRCKDAIRRTEAKFRRSHAALLIGDSKRAFANRRFGAMVALRLRAIANNPADLKELPLRALKRLFWISRAMPSE